MPEAIACDMAMPRGSPTPTYKPSSLQISTMALETRDVVSMGGWFVMGTPPTPIPMLAWISILADIFSQMISTRLALNKVCFKN
jgi:hypothetical protein